MLDKDIHMLDVNGVVQYSFQAESHYCASWWHDVGKKEKIRVNNICFTDTELSGRLNNGTPLFTKIGCAHMAPNGTNISPPPGGLGPPALVRVPQHHCGRQRGEASVSQQRHNEQLWDRRRGPDAHAAHHPGTPCGILA
jgi:hypothetical protein